MSEIGKDKFSSKWGFILACSGSAIGMGNIWLFPYRIAELGGAAFLIPYIICVICLGFVGLLGEMSLGRFTGRGPIGAFTKTLELRGADNSLGGFFGWMSVIVTFVTTVGYSVVIAWIVRFMAGAITGSAFNAADSAQYFSSVTTNHILLWIIVTLFIAYATMFRGVEKGIEKANNIMMPLFLILFIALAVRSAFLPNAIEGYKYLFVAKWEFLFNTRTWILALAQAFYSLSIFGSTMIVYGSYAKKSENIVTSARNVVIFDTAASLLASIVIIPAVFAFGKNLNSGASLMFITMPEIFKIMPFGRLFMIIFFAAILFAGLTSFISILEVVVETLQNHFHIKRFKAVAIVISLIFIGNIWINGELGAFMDILQMYFVPVCALVSGIFVFWVLPTKLFSQEVEIGRNKPISKWVIFMGRYVFCALIIIIYILNILG
ncbi:MAG: sodium-dependent transporter, partial [Elusimicrobiota bacterium]|nr:sodium-dependent transporter [Elusimicrobiota bacterium]